MTITRIHLTDTCHRLAHEAVRISRLPVSDPAEIRNAVLDTATGRTVRSWSPTERGFSAAYAKATTLNGDCAFDARRYRVAEQRRSRA